MPLELNAKVRRGTGKTVNRKLRKNGKFPAVVYGPTGNIMLEMEEKHALHLLENLSGTHKLINLKTEDEGNITEQKVLIKEIQVHPYRTEIIHLDFFSMSKDSPVSVKIPLTPVGVSPGVKLGGVLNMVVRDVEISCLPENIPDEIEVDISKLELNTNLRVKELGYPNGVTPTAKQNFVVAAVVGRAAS